MAKHRAEFSYRNLFLGEFYRLRNRWWFWWKPAIRKGVKRVLVRK